MLFNRKKSNIHSIVIPDFDWSKEESTENKIQWINPEETIALSLNFFDSKPDIPSLYKIDEIRFFYRERIVQQNGGLIEVELIELEKFNAIQTIFKIPQEPTGMVYLASITIPFRNCSYVIKIQAPEVGMTGMRESIVTSRLMLSGVLNIGDDGLENWSSDPYDHNFSEGTLMNKSEEQIYDIDFENHPLTQSRKLILEIKNNIIFKDELEKIKKFVK